VVQGLAPAPAGKTYQAWYISGKETQSAGVFKVGADGMAILSGLSAPGSVDAMAVTLEQEGGVEKPSQKPLVYGKVSG
jgi:anti-sigma-K factor RskA